MNGIKYLLDTNILIGLIKGNEAAIQQLNDVNLQDCAYSSVTRMELLGFPDITQHEIKVISALLDRMTYTGINHSIEDQTITLKQQHRLKLPDAIIAATAIEHKIGLLTLDKRLANKL